MAKIAPKKNKVTGTKKNDKITWVSAKAWKKALTVNAGNGNDIINFKKSKYKNKLNGQNGNDTIFGGKKNDTIDGGAGNDVLYGNGGNDFFKGGIGNDIIYTNFGNNIVYFNSGDGIDTLYKGSGSDTLKFNNFTNLAKLKSELNAIKSGNDLKLYYTKNDCVIIKDYFTSGTSVKNLMDKSGNKLDFSSFMAGVKFKFTGDNMHGTVTGTSHNDIITAGRNGNTIYAENGDDIIYGGTNYADTIYAGAGNDVIYSVASGNHTNCGSGNDKIFITGSGSNYIDLESGNNAVILGSGYTSLTGGDGDNTIIGGSGSGSSFTLGNGNNYIDYSNASGIRITVGNGSNIIKKEGGSDTTIKVGNGNNNSIFAASISYDEVNIGNGNNNIIKIGSNSIVPNSAKINANGGNNNYYYNNTINSTIINYGDGNNNQIIAKAIADESSEYGYAGVIFGKGDNNFIEVNAPKEQKVYIENGSGNHIRVTGIGSYDIRTGVDKDGNVLEIADAGNNYIYAGYNLSPSYSVGDIHSYANDTIETKGIARVTLGNPNTSKLLKTYFNKDAIAMSSGMYVMLENDFNGNVNISLQDNLEELGLTTYFSVIPSPSGPEETYALVYGAIDSDNNYADNEILINNSFYFNGLFDAEDNPLFNFRFDKNKFFIDSNGNTHGLANELQVVDTTKTEATSFDSNDLIYNNGKLKIISGNDGDHITVRDSEDIVFRADASHNKTIDIRQGACGNLSITGIADINSAKINYYDTDSISNLMFSYYGSTDDVDDEYTGTGYITIHAFDNNGKVIGTGDRLYGKWTEFSFDLDSSDIATKLQFSIFGDETEYNLSNMTQYVDMAIYDENDYFDIESASYNLYNICSGNYYVQGTEGDDKYYWEFAGDITINEKSGNDELSIYSSTGYSSLGFLFDVSVTRDSDNNITDSTIGNDLIFASRYGASPNFDKLFSTDAATRNSVATLVIKDYFGKNGANIETIRAYDSHYNDILDYDKLTASIDNNAILQAVTAWLGNHTDYSSVTDAINNCTDQTALNQLAQCYYNNNFASYWIS